MVGEARDGHSSRKSIWGSLWETRHGSKAIKGPDLKGQGFHLHLKHNYGGFKQHDNIRITILNLLLAILSSRDCGRARV